MYINGFLNWYEKWGSLITDFRPELKMYSVKYDFSGTVDLVFKDDKGRLSILDFKTTAVEYDKSLELQLEAYKLLLEEWEVGKVEKAYVLYLKKDGSYNFKLIELGDKFEKHIKNKNLFKFIPETENKQPVKEVNYFDQLFNGLNENKDLIRELAISEKRVREIKKKLVGTATKPSVYSELLKTSLSYYDFLLEEFDKSKAAVITDSNGVPNKLKINFDDENDNVIVSKKTTITVNYKNILNDLLIQEKITKVEMDKLISEYTKITEGINIKYGK